MGYRLANSSLWVVPLMETTAGCVSRRFIEMAQNCSVASFVCPSRNSMFTRYSVGYHRRGNKNTVPTCPKACISALSSNSSTIHRPDLMNIEPALRGARTAASLPETSRGRGATSRIRGHFSVNLCCQPRLGENRNAAISELWLQFLTLVPAGMGRSASTSSTCGIASHQQTYQLVFPASNAHRLGKPHRRRQQPISDRLGNCIVDTQTKLNGAGFWTATRCFSQLISDLENPVGIGKRREPTGFC